MSAGAASSPGPVPARGAPIHCIVLVKQVPDVSNIPEDAWDLDKGTLRRGMLESILNPLDLHAVTFARSITAARPGSRTVYLTMGPPQACDVLVDCMARAPGDGVLLTDRGFAGADTVATAYSLACAVRRIERDFFEGSRDYVIVAGMQSVDGDTAQVPPQIAQELEIEEIAYATSPTVAPPFDVRRIGVGGTETVRPTRLPVMLTLTACSEPLYRSFHATRAARRVSIHEWSAASVQAAPERIGLRGSRTQVVQLFSPTASQERHCVFAHTPEELVALIEERYRQEPAHRVRPAGDAYVLGDRTPAYRGEFWVYIEREGDRIRDVSLALLGRARLLADPLGEAVGAVVTGAGLGGLGDELVAHGADRVYSIEHPLLRQPVPSIHAGVIAGIVRERKPQAMLFGATPLGRELAPRVAYASSCGLTADCTALEIGDLTKSGQTQVAILKQTRPALGGNIMATIVTRTSVTQMATVRPGVFAVPAGDPARVGEIVRLLPDLPPDAIGVEVVATEQIAATSSIRDAEVLVAGGRGLRSRAEFDALLRPLAANLGARLGAPSDVAASRMAVEDGYAGRDRQVGQTGQTVAPRVYVALGISGAVQHVSGMQQAGIVAAVNRDPRARIFDHADLGLVGDIAEIGPALIRAAEVTAHGGH